VVIVKFKSDTEWRRKIAEKKKFFLLSRPVSMIVQMLVNQIISTVYRTQTTGEFQNFISQIRRV
tara:strand:+ start:595 stop:786 length:192 start_codon:yes stop_codon:yes gene_type:complete